MIKTLVPRRENQYSAFPTFAVHRDQLFVFFRQGVKGRWGTHGHGGQVKRLQFDLDTFEAACDDPEREEIGALAVESHVYGEKGRNEMDAIVSDLGAGLFCLATRNFDREKRMRCFVGFSRDLNFDDRIEIAVPGVHWFAFYGKALRVGDELVFPAYGGLDGNDHMQALLISVPVDRRDDPAAWGLLSAIPNGSRGNELNESSLVRAGDRFHLFSRAHRQPFALWHATSTDLDRWSEPQVIIRDAHAPMAIRWRNRVCVSYRYLYRATESEEDASSQAPSAATCLEWPFDDRPIVTIESFPGSIYDGGYSDLGPVRDRLLLVYYQGNAQGEPYLRCWLQEPDSLL